MVEIILDYTNPELIISIVGASTFFIFGILFWILHNHKNKKLFKILFHLGSLFYVFKGLYGLHYLHYTDKIDKGYENGVYTKFFTIVSILFFLLGFLLVFNVLKFISIL